MIAGKNPRTTRSESPCFSILTEPRGSVQSGILIRFRQLCVDATPSARQSLWADKIIAYKGVRCYPSKSEKVALHGYLSRMLSFLIVMHYDKKKEEKTYTTHPNTNTNARYTA